ncbi:amidohydrolase [Thalassotalea litorea]|uniref:Amidohydrolase n=1 Tax=Thalassotalea litorea TaxID=2020715 RepID=A0A5R9ISJ4_9GAMM|nr:amidohydrolase family protein [Thalassotalea litorea]TLU66166.1 amidohydrolase [Thalassotalea litorea]
MIQILINKRMWLFTRLFTCLFIGSFAFVLMCYSQPVFAYQSYLIKNVQILSFSQGKFLAPTNVLVTDGKIKAIQDNISQRDAVEIDGTGQYLIPGFTEMHAHVPPHEISAADVQDLFFLYNAYGITTIRGMLGHPSHLELREQLANNQIDGPRLITSGPSFNGNTVTSKAQAISMVETQKEQGYDFIKIHPGLSTQAFQAMASTATKQQFPFAGHVSASVGVIASINAGQASVDHLDGVMEELAQRSGYQFSGDTGFFGAALVAGIDEKQIEPLAAELAQTSVAMVPTETLMYGFLSWQNAAVSAQKDVIKLMPENVVAQWQETRTSMQQSDWYSTANIQKLLKIRRTFIQAFVEHHGIVLIGSDAPQVFNVPGDSLHEEMHLMKQAGMTPMQVLYAATLGPAKYFNKEQEFGEIAVGRSADMILLKKNPLNDITYTRSIAGVMTRGNWLSERVIEGTLKEIKQKNQERVKQ